MYLIDTYAALTAASAIAANGLLRYVLGGTFPLFTIQSRNSHLFESLSNRSSVRAPWNRLGNKSSRLLWAGHVADPLGNV